MRIFVCFLFFVMFPLDSFSQLSWAAGPSFSVPPLASTSSEFSRLLSMKSTVGGGVAVTQSLLVRTPLGADLLVGVTRSLTLGGVVGVAGRVLAGGVVSAVLVPLAVELFNQARCRQKLNDLTVAQCDEGTPATKQTVDQYCGTLGGVYQCFDTNESFAGAYAGQYTKENGGYSPERFTVLATPTTNGGNVGYVGIKIVTKKGSDWGDGKGSIYSETVQYVKGVMSSVPKLACGSGSTAGGVDRDGKCRSDGGAGFKDVPWSKAVDLVSTSQSNFPSVQNSPSDTSVPGAIDSPRIVEEAIKSGIDINPFASGPDAVRGTVTGPSSTPGVGGEVSTKTSPDGSVQTTTKTTTNNYTYNNNTITNNITTSTVVNNAGAITKTDSSAAPSAAPDIPKTDCEKNPTSLGCQSIDGVPSSDQIPSTSIPAILEPFLLASNTSCPASMPFDINLASVGFSRSFTISYDPLCDVMSKLYPVFTALFSLSAAIVFMNGLKSL